MTTNTADHQADPRTAEETTVSARPGKRSEAFTAAVTEKKLKTGSASRDSTVRVVGLVAMIVGVVGAFVAYQLSLGYEDSRDTGSAQILAVAFLALSVLGVGFYLAGSLSALMRLWLLRQVVESQERHDELVAALREQR
ncbi:hypothetical protein [Nocardioides sp. W7]|uniref:hypothetical protein n=1 Tax=Nocardioides sp. W7 TaxID=2931390 RepID=UPI001FCFE9ED|nr:hypothetical protein [Nocardioides sp. W7]